MTVTNQAVEEGILVSIDGCTVSKKVMYLIIVPLLCIPFPIIAANISNPSLGTAPVISIPYNVTIKEGDSRRILCDVNGIPTPSVKWSDAKGGPLPNNVHQDGQYLVISNADAGVAIVYKCFASNDVGMEFKFTKVILETVPSIVDLYPSTANIFYNFKATFHCQVSGIPKPNIYWYFLPVTGGTISNENLQVNDDGTQMTIPKAVQSGAVYCIAQNSHGTVIKKATLEIVLLAVVG